MPSEVVASEEQAIRGAKRQRAIGKRRFFITSNANGDTMHVTCRKG
jgi:hypothetical protein